MSDAIYRPVIQDMTWSYSRLSSFEDCPYRWYLKYLRGLQGGRRFFSDYGSFMHKIIEEYLTGGLQKSELVPYYLTNFAQEVCPPAPSYAVFCSYFEQGLQYLRREELLPYREPLAVEQKFSFDIDGFQFVGIVDLLARDGALVLVDNKSRALKLRSGKSKPTKADEELDAYLRQLYLYSVPIKHRFGEYPARLEFNCFRTGQLISEPFDPEKLEEAKRWALDRIQTITDNEDWSPNIEFFKCRYICELSDECEFFQLNARR